MYNNSDNNSFTEGQNEENKKNSIVFACSYGHIVVAFRDDSRRSGIYRGERGNISGKPGRGALFDKYVENSGINVTPDRLSRILKPGRPESGEAEELPVSNAAQSGTIGENLTWTLDDEGTLTISGTGEMAESTTYQWNSVKDSIKRIVIESGVTNIAY